MKWLDPISGRPGTFRADFLRLPIEDDSMNLYFGADGRARAVYQEDIDLSFLGWVDTSPHVSRVEPDGLGGWTADLGLLGGPCLGPFPRKSEAVKAEVAWLEQRLGTGGFAVLS